MSLLEYPRLQMGRQAVPKSIVRVVFGVLLGVFGACLPAAAARVDFQRDVRPILADNCFACHGPDEASRLADLRLDTKDGAVAQRPNGPL